MKVKDAERRLGISLRLMRVTLRLIKIEYALRDIECYKNEIIEMVDEISQLNIKEK